MLQYGRIDVFEGIDTNKANDLHKCSFCPYYYFFTMNFKFRTWLCNVCQKSMSFSVMQKPMSFDGVVVVTVKGND